MPPHSEEDPPRSEAVSGGELRPPSEVPKTHALERLVRWLDRHSLLWPATVGLSVFALAGADAYVRGRPGEGFAFALVAVLVVVPRVWYGRRGKGQTGPVETLFGTTSLALLFVVHVTLFGVEPAALVVALASFVALRRWVTRYTFGPTCLYLAVDAVAVASGFGGWAGRKMESVGAALFSSAEFYAALLAVPMAYLYLRVDDWGRARYSWPPFRDDFGFYATVAVVVALSPVAFATEGTAVGLVSAAALVAALPVFMLGVLLSVDRRPSPPWRWRLVALAVLLVELAVLTSVYGGPLETDLDVGARQDSVRQNESAQPGGP